MAALIKLEGIVKQYSGHLAVDEVSFEIPKGQIFGLLGPNGAGKTSIIRMITAITRPDRGALYFDGRPMRAEDVHEIGYMPEERGLYKKMKVGEEILYLARLKGLNAKQAKEHLDYWVARFGIEDWLEKKVEDLSKGMQQKIQFITTVVHRPKLLILDEPFSGLDPVNATLIQSEIDALHRGGTTILFSTHRMEQVEQICQRIVLINRGKNVLEGEVGQIRRDFSQSRYRLRTTAVYESLGLGEVLVSGSAGVYLFELPEGLGGNDLLAAVLARSWEVLGFEEVLPSLHEIFVRVVSGVEG